VRIGRKAVDPRSVSDTVVSDTGKDGRAASNRLCRIAAPIRLRMGVVVAKDGLSVMDEKAYLTVEEVAKRFNINVTTIYRLVQRGKLPAFKIGNQWRFSDARLREWIADRERLG